MLANFTNVMGRVQFQFDADGNGAGRRRRRRRRRRAAAEEVGGREEEQQWQQQPVEVLREGYFEIELFK